LVDVKKAAILPQQLLFINKILKKTFILWWPKTLVVLALQFLQAV
jgi:hypothetical protein